MTTLTQARAAHASSTPQSVRPALACALTQRAELFDALLADLSGQQLALREGALPAILLAKIAQRGNQRRGPTARMQHYAVDLMPCPDGEWRVTRDHVACVDGDDDVGTRLLQAPVLAVFLPYLSRLLLGQSLRLASMPVRWLADRGVTQLIASDYRRWSIRDAFDHDLPAVNVADLDRAQRIEWQSTIVATPWQFVGALLLAAEAEVSRVTLTNDGGVWKAPNV